MSFHNLKLTYGIFFLFIFYFNRKGAETAEGFVFLLSVDPGGIGSAFHRAGTPESKRPQPCGAYLLPLRRAICLCRIKINKC
jgi:hypothetical protein